MAPSLARVPSLPLPGPEPPFRLLSARLTPENSHARFGRLLGGKCPISEKSLSVTAAERSSTTSASPKRSAPSAARIRKRPELRMRPLRRRGRPAGRRSSNRFRTSRQTNSARKVRQRKRTTRTTSSAKTTRPKKKNARKKKSSRSLRVFLGLGSNVGDRRAHLSAALSQIQKLAP